MIPEAPSMLPPAHLSEAEWTLPHLAEVGLAQHPEGVGLATKRDGQWHTSSCLEIAGQVCAFALGLYHLGVRKGDRVVLHAENCTEWVVVDLAVVSIGAVLVPIYTTQPGDQIRYIIEDAGARVYIVSTAALFEALAPHLDALPTLAHQVGIRGVFSPSMHTFASILAAGREQELATPGLYDRLRAAVSPDDLSSIIYTSGTTGLPKGVMLTHRNLVSNVLASIERLPFDPLPGRRHRLLSYLPLSHVFERLVLYIGLSIGCPIYFVASFTDIMEDFKVVEPVHFATVPRLLEKVYLGIKNKTNSLKGPQGMLFRWALALAEAYDVERRMSPVERLQYRLADRLVFSKLRGLFGRNICAVTSGGAALSAGIMNFFNAIGIFCGQGYGMTESAPVLTTYDRRHLRAGSVGKAVRSVTLKIADDGEIWAKGPNVMPGYYNLPEATREVLTADGWLKTGDIGHLDQDGFLFITDRKKALLKLSTGKYVAPQPIEVRLTGCPFIEQAVVVGNGFKFCAALLVPNREALRHRLGVDGDPLSLRDPAVQALIQAEVEQVNAGLPPWEQVKRFHLLEAPLTIEHGELTPTMKVKRRVVYERYRSEIAALYE